MSVILCYGDSNTHGTPPMDHLGTNERHKWNERWPNVMANTLGPKYNVIDEGLPGRTTVHDDNVEGGMRNGMTVLPAILHSHKPIDLMLIMLGTNDLKAQFSVSAFEIARSIERLVLATKIEGVVKDMIIVAPAPISECGALKEVFLGAETRQVGLANYLEEVASRQACSFFDASSIIKVSSVDGVHFGAIAHSKLGQALASVVAEKFQNLSL